MAEVKVDNFLCRMPGCGSASFSAKYKPTSMHDVIGPGSYRPIIGYACDGCSVFFLDPKKFSANQPEKKE